MKRGIVLIVSILVGLMTATAGFCAYHHEGERDAAKFLEVYPEKAGTKLDHCSLCHSGGTTTGSKPSTLGSCQWCHYSFGYDGSGGAAGLARTMNAYGLAYQSNGRDALAIQAIKNLDSDGDTFANDVEIQADRFPGDAADDPSKVAAPFRVYTRAQLEAMGSHTQFLLLNTSRSGDFYAEYTGIPMEDLLADAGMLGTATAIRVYAPDGFATDHPLDALPDPGASDPGYKSWLNSFYVRGFYPESVYYYHEEADQALNLQSGWCDYSAPSCKGRNPGDTIAVSGGLKMILAYKREGAYLDAGILNPQNKLDGEGPLRVVPPQKVPGPPDQLSTSTTQNVVWPYVDKSDHNAGFSSRSVTIIKVLPMPAGTTDINVMEAGWSYVDQDKIIVYGAIDGTDSNGNGILDSEEKGSDPTSDCNGDGTPDFQDPKTAGVRQANGAGKILIDTPNGALADVQAMNDNDPAVMQTGKPAMAFPYGVTKFRITGLGNGDSVTLTLTFPGNVPVTAKYYKVTPAAGWQEVPFGSNNGDNTITLTLTDGDPKTDADGLANGEILDPGAIATVSSTPSTAAAVSGGGGGGGCFINMLGSLSSLSFANGGLLFGLLVAFIGFAANRKWIGR